MGQGSLSSLCSDKQRLQRGWDWGSEAQVKSRCPPPPCFLTTSCWPQTFPWPEKEKVISPQAKKGPKLPLDADLLPLSPASLGWPTPLITHSLPFLPCFFLRVLPIFLHPTEAHPCPWAVSGPVTSLLQGSAALYFQPLPISSAFSRSFWGWAQLCSLEGGSWCCCCSCISSRERFSSFSLLKCVCFCTWCSCSVSLNPFPAF